jgi:hypothetical protein
MKRMLLPFLASSLLVLLLPAVASAHHGRHHHARSHKRHATSARLVNFGASLSGATGTPSAPIQGSPSDEKAGTIESFEGGVLKIKLGDGSVVSGKVTDETELRCQPATPTSEPGDDDGGGDEQSGTEGDEQHGSSAPNHFATQHGDFFAHSADSQGGGDDQGDDENGGQQQESCTIAALVPHTAVLEAELKLSSAGAVWEKLDIVH